MTTSFDRAQAAYDHAEPPEPACEHEDWSSDERTYITPSTEDISIKCDTCKESGSLDFQPDGTTIIVRWDDQ